MLTSTARKYFRRYLSRIPYRSFTTNNTSNNVDTLIIGGGPIGLSTAYHLAVNYRNNDGTGIAIIERDPTYARSSATLSAGGIRQQFSLKENVEMR